jgi:single-strand DNA-binding protein
MASLNKVMLIGRLTRDPEMRYLPSGQPLTTFAIATNRYGKGTDGENKEYTDYHNIVAWNMGKNTLAERVAQYLRKGSLVYVEGRLSTRTYESQTGEKKKLTEVIATTVEFLDSRGAGAAASVPAHADAPGPIEDAPRDVDPDDIPF